MNRCATRCFFCVLVSGLLFSTVSVAADDSPIHGALHCFAYGYRVAVTVNGTPLKIMRGGGSQSTLLFSADHPRRSQAGPGQQDLFILREGENSITVTFERQGEALHDLKIRLEVLNYSQPLFQLESSKRMKGTVERKFIIEKKMPADFQTVRVTDENL